MPESHATSRTSSRAVDRPARCNGVDPRLTLPLLSLYGTMGARAIRSSPDLRRQDCRGVPDPILGGGPAGGPPCSDPADPRAYD
jgi:hypothetical protein